MQVKGTAFQARRDMIVQMFGEEKWRSFISRLSEQEPFWEAPIFSITLIPDHVFLIFLDELVKEFFSGDPQTFWEFGVRSAEWSLIEGPYKSFLETKDVTEFVGSVLPSLWGVYYTSGELEARIQDNVIHARVKGVSIPHIHFEFSVMGYIKRALELMEIKNIEVKRIKGFDSEDKEIYYQFVLDA